MSVIDHEIMTRVQQLSEEQKQGVLDYLRNLETAELGVRLSARELIKLPLEERQRIVAASFALASDEDFEIFEAYSEEDPNDAG